MSITPPKKVSVSDELAGMAKEKTPAKQATTPNPKRQVVSEKGTSFLPIQNKNNFEKSTGKKAK